MFLVFAATIKQCHECLIKSSLSKVGICKVKDFYKNKVILKIFNPTSDSQKHPFKNIWKKFLTVKVICVLR